MANWQCFFFMLVAYKLLNIEARLTCEESDVMACYATKVVEQIFAPFGCRLLHVFNDAMILSLYMRAFFFFTFRQLFLLLLFLWLFHT